MDELVEKLLKEFGEHPLMKIAILVVGGVLTNNDVESIKEINDILGSFSRRQINKLIRNNNQHN